MDVYYRKILTGMVPPTSGKAEILGFDTWSQWAQVQRLIGLCPQQSILYPSLSSLEHLTLYGKIKSELSSEDLDLEVLKFIKAMNMEKEALVPVKKLSEGMRRRLCVSLAFIGGSKVVILDEPTSGVDPIARRQIWQLITDFKKDRTIIFTTHHLDEAELLSDKVAIVHQGSLLASGSLKNLKSELGGSGFELTLNPLLTEDENFKEVLLPHVQSTVPDATELPKRHKNDKSARFKLPMLESNSDMIQLFGMLDNESEKLGVESYNLECTSLEQIFLDMERKADNPDFTEELEDFDDKSEISEITIESLANSGKLIRKQLLSGFSLHCSQFMGLLQKRLLHSMRDWKYLSTIILLPSVLLAISMGLGLLKPTENLPPLLMTPSIYGPTSHSFIE